MACLSVLLYRRVKGVGKWICCYHTGMKILNLCRLVFGVLMVQPGLADGTVVNREVFASGWLQGEEAWGRPNDVMVMPDGALLVSDDYADVVYRISYEQ